MIKSTIIVVEIFGESWYINFSVGRDPWSYSVHLYKAGCDYPPQISFYKSGLKPPTALNFYREYAGHKSEFGLSPKEARRKILKVLTNDLEEANKNFRR